MMKVGTSGLGFGTNFSNIKVFVVDTKDKKNSGIKETNDTYEINQAVRNLAEILNKEELAGVNISNGVKANQIRKQMEKAAPDYNSKEPVADIMYGQNGEGSTLQAGKSNTCSKKTLEIYTEMVPEHDRDARKLSGRSERPAVISFNAVG